MEGFIFHTGFRRRPACAHQGNSPTLKQFASQIALSAIFGGLASAFYTPTLPRGRKSGWVHYPAGLAGRLDAQEGENNTGTNRLPAKKRRKKKAERSKVYLSAGHITPA